MDSPTNKSNKNPTEPSQLANEIQSQTVEQDSTSEENTQVLNNIQDVAVVKEIQMGSGELYCNKMKYLKCVLQSGVEFKIGTGFTEYDQLNPPKIGETIQFICTEIMNGVPRFPRYLPPQDKTIINSDKETKDKSNNVQIQNEGEQNQTTKEDISKLANKLEDLSLVK